MKRILSLVSKQNSVESLSGRFLMCFVIGLSVCVPLIGQKLQPETQKAAVLTTDIPIIEEPQAESFFLRLLPNAVKQYFQASPESLNSPSLIKQGTATEQMSILLDGTTGFVKVPNGQLLSISSRFTVEAWVMPLETGKTQPILEKYQPGVGGYSLEISQTGVVQFSRLGENERNSNVFVGTSSVTPNTWHHLACTYDGISLTIFLDGKLDARYEMRDGSPANSGELTIGRKTAGEAAEAFFKGSLDEIRISTFVVYGQTFTPERKLYGAGLIELTAGSWRFSDQNFYDGSGNNNHGTGVGGVYFVKESDTQTDAAPPSPEAVPCLPGITTCFDDLPDGAYLHNAYSSVSFVETNGLPMRAWYDCNVGGGPCGGQSLPNYATSQTQYGAVAFNFAQPANITKFRIIAIDSPYGWVTGRIAFRQDGVYYYGLLGSNGYDVPLDILINQKQCGTSACTRVTQVVVYGIVDDLGYGFDDFSYTLPNPSTPTPPPCLSGGEHGSVMPPCQPTPTPPPAVPNAPTNFVATNERGRVNLKWEWAPTTANPNPVSIFKIERANASTGPWSEVILQNGLSTQRSYDDRKHDLRMDQTRYYRIIAYNNAGASPPSNVTSGAPLSACTVYPPYSPPSIPSGGAPFSAYTWTGRYKFEHGFSVADVALNGRLMAKHMGVPQMLFYGVSGTGNNAVGIDLDNSQPQGEGFVSRLYGFREYPQSEKGRNGHNLEAKYCVSSGSGQERWDVTLQYRFEQEKIGDTCEPSSGLPCARFYPYVTFDYVKEGTGPNEGQPFNVSMFQRLHFKENDDPNNVIALVRDCDNVELVGSLEPGECRPSEFPIDFRGTINPVDEEIGFPFGVYLYSSFPLNFRKYDNIHQTGIDKVSMPGLLNNENYSPAGCPSCIHDHWRWTNQWFSNSTWGAWTAPGTFSGRPIIGLNYRKNGRPQEYGPDDLQMGFASVCKYHASEFNEVIPCGTSGRERLFHKVRNSTTSTVADQGSDVVFWYIGMAVFKPVIRDGVGTYADIFHAHGGFFQPVRNRFIEKNLTLQINGAIPQPTKLLVENYYKHDGFPFDNINAIPDVASTNSLPPGYTKVVGSEYNVKLPSMIPWLPSVFPLLKIGSDVSGSHVLTYKVPDSTSLETFNRMRILHREADFYEVAWIDRTILSGSDAPNFQTKIIKARVTSIGQFVVATINPGVAPGTAPTDLKLLGNVNPSSVNAGSNATYTLTITNEGANPANDVILAKTISTATSVVSATASQGTCHGGTESLHEIDATNNLRCTVGNIAPGATVTVTLITNVHFFGDGIETQPVEVSTWADVSAAEADSDTSDNSLRLIFNALPSPNKPPTASITAPPEQATYVATSSTPASIPINVNAADDDGTVTEVQIFDTGVYVGNAALLNGNVYTFTLNTNRYGYHTLKAVAKDNGGRTGAPSERTVLVNGPNSISFVEPQQQQFLPGATVLVQTTSSIVGSRVQKIELLANGEVIGKLRSVSNTGSIYSHQFSWQNVPRGRYEITAILTDISGATSFSAPKNIVVSNPPTVAITSPTDAAVFPSANSVTIDAQVSDPDGYVQKTEFFASGAFLDSKAENIASGSTSLKWLNPEDGIYSLVAVVTDDLGLQATSAPINIGINRTAPSIGELIWLDDAVPTGASSGGDDGWNWTNATPVALLGGSAHTSSLKAGLHEHYFENSSFRLPVYSGEKLSTWIFIDPDFAPAEVMLQWKSEQGWEHRAYWGENLIDLGTDGTNSRRAMGPIPTGYGWKQLKVPASLVGLEGKLVNGMKFTLHGGRATWDRVGKLLASAPEPGPPQPDFVWNDDHPPSGSILEALHDSWNVVWTTTPFPHSGTRSHKHWDTDNNEPYRQHSFRNASEPMYVDPGDTLFTYVYLHSNPEWLPDTLVLQWYDANTGWLHRAFWGRDFRQHIHFGGHMAPGTESWRHMGDIPPHRNQWVRLEVPASYVGVEGKAVTGMAFGVYRHGRGARAVWDYSGKTSAAPQGPLSIPALKFTSPLYRFACGSGNGQRQRYYQNRDFNFPNEHNCTNGVNIGYIYGSQMPGTIPLWVVYNQTHNRWRIRPCHNCEEQWGYFAQYIVGYVPTTQIPDTVVHSQWKVNSNDEDYYTTYPNPPDQAYPFCCTFQWNMWGYFVHSR